uniref:Acyltransferase n=1 Tax=Parastrongyloides trichosuri TaxID=131310 RepID=A0A0N4Z0L4_PARTI
MVEFAPLNISLSRRLQTFAVAFYLFLFLILPVIIVYVIYCLAFSSFWWLLCIYFGWWLILDRDTYKTGGSRKSWMRNCILWKWMANYFPIKLHKTAELRSDRNYIIGCHPHGILSFGHFLNFATESTGFSEMFPGIVPSLVTLPSQFLIPFRREIVKWTGSISSDVESIQHTLEHPGGGRAACIVIGGAEEALDAKPDTNDLILSRRKGFCRLALKNGASLVPLYNFGENKLYNQVTNEKGGRLRAFQTKFKDITGFSAPIFMGRGIFQYSWGILPYRQELNTVIGTPIEVDKIEGRDPTKEEIDELHKKYCDSLIKLFDDNKEKYGFDKDAKLNIH